MINLLKIKNELNNVYDKYIKEMMNDSLKDKIYYDVSIVFKQNDLRELLFEIEFKEMESKIIINPTRTIDKIVFNAIVNA